MGAQDHQNLPQEEPVETYLPEHTQQKEEIAAIEPGEVREKEVQPEKKEQVDPAWEKKEKKEGKSRKWVGKALKTVGALALVAVICAGSCFATAKIVGMYWKNQMDLLNRSVEEKISVLQEKLDDTGKINSENLAIAVEEGLTPRQVYEQNVQAVVSVMNLQKVEGKVQPVGTGTGFFISQDGYIVTNYHVIHESQSLAVITCDDQQYPARVVGVEVSNDIAVLKIEAEGMPFVKVGSSDALQVGEQVAAVGNALGQLHSTLTVGYISAKDRMVTTDGSSMTMLQTDAAINSGNSGGPLFNMRGELVGITTAKYSGFSGSGATIEGIGFAIPIDDVIQQIRDLQQFGYITGAYMGVTVMELDAGLAEAYGLPAGLRIQDVTPEMAAARAGILAGDVLTNVGGFDVSSISELSRVLRRFKAGDTTTVTVYRGGQLVRMLVAFDEKPRSTPIQNPMPSEGKFDEWYEYFKEYFGAE